MPVADLDKMIKELDKEMKTAARNLEFEKAAGLRDQVVELRRLILLKDVSNEEDPISESAELV